MNVRQNVINSSTKEVLAYREAIDKGFLFGQKQKNLSNNIIKQIQAEFEHNSAGFRTVHGPKLESSDGNVVYIPPQDGAMINKYMQKR